MTAIHTLEVLGPRTVGLWLAISLVNTVTKGTVEERRKTTKSLCYGDKIVNRNPVWVGFEDGLNFFLFANKRVVFHAILQPRLAP